MYRGTRDGFGFNDYVNKVESRGNLLTIIKSEYDKVFGCFIGIPRTVD